MTNTDICNMALSYLARTIIKSVEENSEEARQCQMFYETTRKLLLRSYPWGFANRLIRLARLDREMPGFSFVYKYPSSCLAVRYVYDTAGAGRRIKEKAPFEVMMTEGDVTVIATDVEDAWAEYTADVRDVDRFSPEFSEALAHYLASQMAIPLTGNANVKMTEYQLFQALAEQARKETAEERQRDLDFETPYARARFS